jgi:uncharacterized protein YukE
VTTEHEQAREEFAACLRRLVDAFQPLVAAAKAAMAELVKALQPIAQQLAEQTKPGRARRDRPAWMSPYGPPTRHRFP